MDSVKRYSRDEARKKAQWVSDCRKLQKRVAKLNRALDSAKAQLDAATAAKNLAVVRDLLYLFVSELNVLCRWQMERPGSGKKICVPSSNC